MSESLPDLLASARACRVCEASLSHGPRPVLTAGADARIVIVGQAPGSKVHASGVPWQDDSGDRLRGWLGIDDATFYDPERVSLLPMGFCYPGKGPSADLPPRPECAPLWHPQLMHAMPAHSLTLLVGLYAQAYYLGRRRKKTLTATVQTWQEYAPDFLPLPHPSWRVRTWMKRNPWFRQHVVVDLRDRVRATLENP